MINVNQRIGQPFGDIYTPVTSHTDRLAQQFYAEEKQREAQERQMQDALDNEFSKNLTGIRDIDTDDLTKAYGDFKLANKSAMRQRDGVSPKQQMELLKKKAAMYDIINKSKTQKALEDDVLKGLGSKDRDNYEDNAHEILMQSRATPLSKLGGLYGYDYSYKGTNTDFQKIDNLAMGQPKQVYAKEDLVDVEGIQTKITPYMFGNTPSQYYEGMLGALAEKKAGRDAAILISKVPTEIIEKTQEEYLQIPIEKWEKMGVGKAQDLTITPNDSKAQAYAKHKAQLYALNNEPKEGVPTYRTNEAKKINKLFVNAKVMEGIKFSNSLQKIKAYKQGQPPQEDAGYLSDNVAYEVGEDVEIDLGGGKSETKRVIYVDKVDPKRLSIINGEGSVRPIEIKQPNGTYRKAYYQDLNTKDWQGKGGVTISRERVKDDYINTVSSSKFKTQSNTKASENTTFKGKVQKALGIKPKNNKEVKLPGE